MWGYDRVATQMTHWWWGVHKDHWRLNPWGNARNRQRLYTFSVKKDLIVYGFSPIQKEPARNLANSTISLGTGAPPSKTSRKRTIELIDAIFRDIADKQTVVYAKPVEALLSARAMVLANGEMLATSGGAAHTSRWTSDWFFTLLEYDPNLYI
ncbi:hypothetical protein F5B18DRAFT_646688 [Nemania serpens]|nr:hypothetical protein F5B18DRAFT_646688 [Nemania serpens]